MITLISFFIVLLGAFNWFSIGLMQYDFIAGVFGTQSSFLSRAIYIIVGFAGIWLVIMAFTQKGKIKINDNGFKKDPLKAEKHPQKAMAVEYDKEFNQRSINQENQNFKPSTTSLYNEQENHNHHHNPRYDNPPNERYPDDYHTRQNERSPFE